MPENAIQLRTKGRLIRDVEFQINHQDGSTSLLIKHIIPMKAPKLQDLHFSKLKAPYLGVLLGGCCGIQNPFIPGGALPAWVAITGGAIIGGIAGILVLILDPSTELTKKVNSPAETNVDTRTHSTLVGRTLSLFGILLCWTPILGFLLNAIGVYVNRGTQGLSGVVAKIGLIIGTITSAITLSGIFLGW